MKYILYVSILLLLVGCEYEENVLKQPTYADPIVEKVCEVDFYCKDFLQCRDASWTIYQNKPDIYERRLNLCCTDDLNVCPTDWERMVIEGHYQDGMYRWQPGGSL